MESAPFKSKKILHSTSKPSPSPSYQTPIKSPDQAPLFSKTPEKSINPTSRTKSLRTALFLEEVKQMPHNNLHKLDPDPHSQPDPVMSPAKASETAAVAISKMTGDSFKLPEMYEILEKFFNSLDSSIRLLRLKGSMSTFTNIRPKIECLTDRRFTYSHLAQLKYIYPEAIEVRKILVHDERTDCMEPDLHVTLNVNVVENDEKLKSESGNSLLRKVFHSRLLDFSQVNPKGDEVPEETLPEPFNQSKQDLLKNTIKASNSPLMNEVSTDALSEQQPAAAAHLSQSFRRRFSQQDSNQKAVNITQTSPVVSLQAPVLVPDRSFDQCSSITEITAPDAPSPTKLLSKATIDEDCVTLGASAASLPPSHPAATPVKNDSIKNEDCSSVGTASFQGTPVKLVSTPAKLMSATPALQPPKRCCMSPDDDWTKSSDILVKRPPRSRSLKFDTPVKSSKNEDEVNETQILSVDNDILDIVPDNLLQSIREKERKALEDQDPAISQAKWRQQMIARLPKLFDRIHFLFQSINRSIITKEELLHKIIASDLDIVDRREVEEQLRLLQELVPELIYEKLTSSGDLLVCINKTMSPESLCTRLSEAN